MDANNVERYDEYYDMDQESERGEDSEAFDRLCRQALDSFLSDEQLANKGNLLGCYKSRGFLRTYIEVYENAFIGKAEVAGSKKAIDIGYGYICLEEALVERGVLYLIMGDEIIYRLRNIKLAEEVAYRMNIQKQRTKG